MRPIPETPKELKELDAEPGWVEVRPFPFIEARRSFTGWTGEDGRIAIRYFRHEADGALVAKVWFGPRAEGAPGRAHGGGVLTVLDEAMGAAVWILGRPVLTVRMTAVFRRGVPLGRALIVATRVERLARRMAKVSARLSGRDGVRYAESEGEFAMLGTGKFREVFGPLPAEDAAGP